MSRIAALSLAALPAAAAAQTFETPVDRGPPSEARSLPAGAVNPLVTYHMRRHNLPRAQAEERVAIQGDILRVLENPVFANDPDFAGVSVQHEPVYRIFLTYFDNDAKSELLTHIPARMRRYIQIRKAKHDRAARAGRLSELNAALAAAGVPFIAFYHETDERFVVHGGTAANVARLQALVPEPLRSDTQVIERTLPRAEQTSGQKNYYILAGHALNPGCTLGFPITYTYGGVAGRKGILTAGHCTDAGAVRTLDWSDGTRTTFERAIWSINTGNYDFAIYDLTGIPTDYRIFYRNNVTYGGYTNNVPQFPASGHLNTKNFIRQSGSWVGMNVCKNGTYTGLTCGQISSLNYPWRGVNSGTSFVYVDQSQQQNLSTSGDSGGPWFTWTDPSASLDVSALGVHVAGSGAGYGGSGIYMPIDRIFNTFTGGPSSVRLTTTPW
jgi:hypothetical protein